MLDHAFDLYDSSDLRGALAVCEKILGSDSSHYGALYLSGSILAELKDFEEAISRLDHATRLDPTRKTAWFNLAKACHDAGKATDAHTAIKRFITLDPLDPEGPLLEGAICYKLKDFDEAIGAANRALRLKSDFVEAFCNRGRAFLGLNRAADARESFVLALRLKPDFAEGLAGLAGAEYLLDNQASALANADKALALRHDHRETLSLRAQIHCAMGNLAQAVSDTNRLRTLDPDKPEWLPLTAEILTHSRRIEEAARLYDAAVEADPGTPSYRYQRAFFRLATGDLPGGFEDYEARLQIDSAPPPPPVPAPLWRGEPLQGRSIVIQCEQGLGDTIQFCRYARLLADAGALVTLAPQRPIARLLEGLGSSVEICPSVDMLRRFDFGTLLLSVPFCIGTDLDTLPSATPYLRAQPARADAWRQRIGGDGFKVGIAWQGSRNAIDIGRSFPLARFAPLSRIPGVRLISLQKNDGAEQIEALPEGTRVETLGPDFDSGADAFLDTAAVMQSLDLVITSDTAVAHLAGALARPTWVVLKHTPDWRWMLERPDSPWYPTMRLFRQKTQGDWPGVFVEIEKALRALGQRAQGGSP